MDRSNADGSGTATLANDNEESHAPGSKPAHFNQGRNSAGGDRDFPGRQPDEVSPGKGDTDIPDCAPDEVAPDQGDFDQPDRSPAETPPQPDTGPAQTQPD